MDLRDLFKNKVKLAVFAAGSLAAGVLNGLIGTGGGIILTYVFSLVLVGNGYTSKDIFVTAMAAILPISVFSLVSCRAEVLRDASFVIPTVTAAAAGGITGAVIGTKVKAVFLERLFSALVIWAGINMIAGGIR